MTIKKILISAATAGLLAATITGCGDDSSSSSSDNGSSTGTASIQTSTQAVDGYIYNAVAKAYYLADDNKTMKSITMESTPTTKDVVTKVVTLGSSTYKLPADTNASVKSRIKFFAMTSKGSGTSGTTYTPASYIEADGTDGYDTNDTLLGATTIYAPANSKIASPITSMVVSGLSSVFGTTTAAPTSVVDLNATTFANIEANATALAKKLGLGDVDLLTADPVALAKSNPTFKLVTALLKDATAADFTTIMKLADATDLKSTLDAVAATGATGAALANSLSASVANGAFSVADIAGMNIEKSVDAGSIVSLTPPTVAGKFPLSDINVSGISSEDFAASGAKIDNTNFTADITFADNIDKNISTTKFKLVVAIKGSKDFVSEDDSNESGALVVELPFDLNSTNGTLATSVAAGTLVPYEAKASDGSEVVYKNDVNASTLSVDGTNVVTTSGKTVSFDLKALLKNVKDNSADNNLTSPKVTDLSCDEISSVQAYLVDVDGKVIGTDSTGKNSQPLAKGDLNGIMGDISATEAIKIINLGDADLRGTVATANNAPVVNLMDGNAKGATVKTNYADAAPVTTNPFTVTINGDAGERNNSVTVSGLPSWVTVTKSTLISPADVDNPSVDFNLTKDSNLTIGDTNTTAYFSVTDEFGKKNTTDANLSFFFNAVPKVDTTKTTSTTGLTTGLSNFKAVSKTQYTLDMNVTEVNNTKVYFYFSNLMGDNNDTNQSAASTFNFVDLNTSNNVNVKYTADVNGTTGVGYLTLSDLNSSTQGDQGDFNVTISDQGLNVIIDVNVSK